jgi:hypothetical protein
MKRVDAGVVGDFSKMKLQACCCLCGKSSGLLSAGYSSSPYLVRLKGTT